MPSIVGPFKIDSIGSAGVAQFGDTMQITPKNTSKTYAGQGSFSTGDAHFLFNGISSTFVPDSDLVDATNTGNN